MSATHATELAYASSGLLRITPITFAQARDFVAKRPARPGWNCPSRPRNSTGTEGIARTRWVAQP